MHSDFLVVVLVIMLLMIGGLTGAVVAISLSLQRLWEHYSGLVNQVVRLPSCKCQDKESGESSFYRGE